MDWEGEKLIRWLHERCGKSEESHGVMKDDSAGGKLPSDDFGLYLTLTFTAVIGMVPSYGIRKCS
jgi:hypothetical protein